MVYDRKKNITTA